MRKATAITVIALVAALAACQNSGKGTETAEATTQAETEAEERIKLVGIPYIPGAVDLANYAIMTGGNTTYVSYSDLIGMKVQQDFTDGSIIEEILVPDTDYIRTNNSSGGTDTLRVEIHKTEGETTATYNFVRTEDRDQLLETFYKNSIEDNTKGTRLWSELTEMGTISNEYGSLTVTDTSLEVTAKVGPLSVQQDIIAYDEFRNGLDAQGIEGFNVLKESIKETGSNELNILNTGDNNGISSETATNSNAESKGIDIDGFTLASKTFIIRYAPKGEKTDNIQDWQINNYDARLVYQEQETGRAFTYIIKATNKDNIYNDKREVLTGITSDSLTQEELNVAVRNIYWDGAEQLTMRLKEDRNNEPQREEIGYVPDESSELRENDKQTVSFYHIFRYQN